MNRHFNPTQFITHLYPAASAPLRRDSSIIHRQNYRHINENDSVFTFPSPFPVCTVDYHKWAIVVGTLWGHLLRLLENESISQSLWHGGLPAFLILYFLCYRSSKAVQVCCVAGNNSMYPQSSLRMQNTASVSDGRYIGQLRSVELLPFSFCVLGVFLWNYISQTRLIFKLDCNLFGDLVSVALFSLLFLV